MKDAIYGALVSLSLAMLHFAMKVAVDYSYYKIDDPSDSLPQPVLEAEIPLSLGDEQKALHVSVYEGKDREGERIVLQMT